MPAREWYDEGLRFECTMCGACCTGAPGYVRFTEAEGRAIASRLGIAYERFIEGYTQDAGVEGLERSLSEVQTEFGWDCVFLDRQRVPGKAVCSLYEDRPTQCRTFPWWPEHLASPRAWQRLGRTCEGVGRGAVVPVEAIRVERERQRASTTDR
ncbi:MAG TPA: zinc/iron-chelating domain-containing protein [Phycisphaerales bacterium]|nr:zinc/iron-chelating domain-containing protein [Phycisphaerales bacterium]